MESNINIMVTKSGKSDYLSLPDLPIGLIRKTF